MGYNDTGAREARAQHEADQRKATIERIERVAQQRRHEHAVHTRPREWFTRYLVLPIEETQ